MAMRIKSFIVKLSAVLILSLTLMIPFIIELAQASMDFWTPKAPLPTARTLLEVAVVNDKISAIAAIGVFFIQNNYTCRDYGAVEKVWR